MIDIGRAIWLCLRFERLALEVFSDRDDARAIAVVEQQCVHVANRDILEPGTAVATAHALCPDLLALARQPEREAQTLRQLAHWAYGLTPEVVVAADNSLLLEIGSCRRLYGDLTRLLDAVAAGLAARGHAVGLGLAHTPKAAWLLARQGTPAALTDNGIDAEHLQRQLQAVPVADLPLEPKPRQALLAMGLTRLGAVLPLPPASLGRRLGRPALRYLQQLCGTHPDPQPPFRPEPVFDQSVAFIDGIVQKQGLLFPMKRLVLALCDYLTARQLRCRVLRWSFFDAQQLRAEMTVELAQAGPGWRSLLELSQLKLDALALPEMVFAVALGSDRFAAVEAGSLALFEAAEEGDADAGLALIDRLASRLGSDALQRLSAPVALWPEAASVLVGCADAATAAPAPAGARPAWLLPEPVPLRQRGQQLLWESSLELLRGPERIAAPPGSVPVGQRDYYVARADDGRLCWIFREVGSGRWFAHGLFA